MKFGELIKTLRSQQGRTLQYLSEKSGIDTGTISRIENGKSEATLLIAIRLCSIFGIDSCMVMGLKHVIEAQELLSYKCNYEDTDTVLTQNDIDTFIHLSQQDRQHGYSVLATYLENIAKLLPESESVHKESLPELSQEDMTKLLKNSPLYQFDIKYPFDIQPGMLLQIARNGGYLIPEDVTVFARQIRKDMQTRKRKGRRIDGILSRLETGILERVGLEDILELDEALELHGDVLRMCWTAYSRLAPSPEIDLRGPQSIEQELMLATVLVKICRWLTVLYKDDLSWLKTLRETMKKEAAYA